jgi:hypothetical protein
LSREIISYLLVLPYAECWCSNLPFPIPHLLLKDVAPQPMLQQVDGDAAIRQLAAIRVSTARLSEPLHARPQE